MHPDRYSLACGSQPRQRVQPPVGTGATGPVVRQSLSNFRPRLGGLCPVFSFPVSLRFYFMLFLISISRLRRLFHVCDVLHDFDFVSFCSASLHFSENFFSVRPSSLLWCVHVSVPVTEVGHYLRSRGWPIPWDPAPHTLSSDPALSPPPPRLVPAF